MLYEEHLLMESYNKINIKFDSLVVPIDFFKVLVISAFFAESLLIYIKAILGRLPVISIAAPYFFPVLFLFLILVNGKYILKYVRLKDLAFVFIVLAVFAISYYMHPENREYFNERNMSLLFYNAIPFFILGICVDFRKNLVQTLIKISYITIMANLLYLPYYMSTRQLSDDSMWMAYLIMLPTLMAIYGVFSYDTNTGKRLWPILFSVIGIVYILSMGTRGPAVIVAAYFCIMFYRNSKRNIWLKLLLILAVIIVTLVIISNQYIGILYSLRSFLLSRGLSTRSIDLLIQGEFISHTSNRDVIYELLFSKLKERPLTGYGVFGEWRFVNYSAHNIFLELCMNFGYPIGILLMGTHIFLVMKAYVVSNNSIAKDMILLFSCYAYIRGIFGGNYLNLEFTFLLGLALHELRIHKQLKKEKDRIMSSSNAVTSATGEI